MRWTWSYIYMPLASLFQDKMCNGTEAQQCPPPEYMQRFKPGRIPPYLPPQNPSLIQQGDIPNHDAEDPAVDAEEEQRREPQAGAEGADPQELELEGLLQPEGLARDPQREGQDAAAAVPE